MALAQELPLRWLRDRKIPVYELVHLGNDRITAAATVSGIAVVITGTGLQASRRAALAIRDRVAPRCVVNIGTAGALAQHLRVGDWWLPTAVACLDGSKVGVDSRLPFSLPAGIAVASGGLLLSVNQPLLTRPLAAWADFAAVDMEACAQAEIFAETAISFHVMKSISDRPGTGRVHEQFRQHLRRLRFELQTILGALGPQGRPEPELADDGRGKLQEGF